MKECEGIALELPGFVNGKLDASAAGSVRMHLESCAGCRDEVRRLEYLEELLTAHFLVIEPSPTFASTFANRLAAEIAAEEGHEAVASAESGLLGWLFRPWLIPVAVAAAAVLGGLLITPWLSQSPGPNIVIPKVPSAGDLASTAAKKPAVDTKVAAETKHGDTKLAAANTANAPAKAGGKEALPATADNEMVAANDAAPEDASSPPEDVVQRPELFVDFAVIRDLDILDSDKSAG